MERYRILLEAGVYCLTYSVVGWLPVFVTEATCRVVTESLTFCHRQKHLRINAFVIMPTHLHLIAFDEDFDTERLARTLADFRKFTGRQLGDHCSAHFPACFAAALRAQATADRHPEASHEERFWRQKLDYLHDNPCRKGLVRQPEHGCFSSAAWYLADGQGPSEVPLTAIVW
jgi:hypothetical protein